MAGIKTIRDSLESRAVKILVGAIVITFALFFGWGTVFSSSEANVVASVNGKKIDLYDLDLEMAQIQSILSQRFDNPDFTIEEQVLKSLAINSLIRDSLILGYLENNQVKISNLTAYKLLSQNEIFQEEGKLSVEKINSFARQNGFLPGKYIENIRNRIALDFWTTGISNTDFITSNEFNKNVSLAKQTRDVVFLKINKEEKKKDIRVSKADIVNFYDENNSYFMTRPKAKIRYIEISQEEISKNLLINDADLELEYQAYLENFDSTIRKTVSHIMLNINKERTSDEALMLIENLKNRINQGEDFETIAQEFSEDEGTKNLGGSLGVTDGTAFPDEFEIELNNMSEGGLSSPILLNSRVHLLKLTNLLAPTPEEFENIKQDLIDNLSQQFSYQEFVDTLEEASDLTFSYSELEPISERINLNIKTSQFFSRSEADGFFNNDQILDLVFNELALSAETGVTLLELNDESAILIELLSFQESKLKEFEEVQEEVEGLLVEKVVSDDMNALEKQILEKLNNQSYSLSKVESDHSLKRQTYKSVTRSSSLFTKNALFEIFDIPRSDQGKLFKAINLPQGDRLILKVDSVEEAKEGLSQEEKSSLNDFFVQERSDSNLVDLQISMQEEASIIIN
ncbi:MAG: SurA N-terminal domain-containing protein [Gammaproteobacteria bacterium]